MIYAVTGHRPNKLGGFYDYIMVGLRVMAFDFLKSAKPDSVLSGMALGWDQCVVEACLQLKISFVACIPCDGQEKLWHPQNQARYHQMLSLAKGTVNVSPGPYAAWKMQARNEYMVDHCDHLLALWDGSSGGTANCVNYAIKKGIPWTNLWPKWTGV